MNPAGEPDLNDEPRDGQIELDLAEKRRDAGRAARARGLLDRHVELLVEQPGPDGGEADDQRDQLQMPRFSQHLKRPLSADAFLGTRGGDIGETDSCRPHHAGDDRDARQQQDSAHEDHRVRADLLDQQRQRGGSGHAAQTGAAADEPKEPLGLTRVVDVVGERPELADQKQTHDLPEEVERDRCPRLAGLKQEPEQGQKRHQAELGDGDHRAWRQSPGCP